VGGGVHGGPAQRALERVGVGAGAASLQQRSGRHRALTDGAGDVGSGAFVGGGGGASAGRGVLAVPEPQAPAAARAPVMGQVGPVVPTDGWRRRASHWYLSTCPASAWPEKNSAYSTPRFSDTRTYVRPGLYVPAAGEEAPALFRRPIGSRPRALAQSGARTPAARGLLRDRIQSGGGGEHQRQASQRVARHVRSRVGGSGRVSACRSRSRFKLPIHYRSVARRSPQSSSLLKPCSLHRAESRTRARRVHNKQ
jgi:hypothetical protein